MRNYDIIKYLNGFHPNSRINDLTDIQAILEFSIFWNNFEDKITKNKYPNIEDDTDLKTINNKDIECFICKKLSSDNSELLNILEYFLNRYFGENKKGNFDDLKRKGKISILEKELHKKCGYNLKNITKIHFKDKIEVISYIIYRFRNNLFHWGKKPISEQNENFIVINTFLHYLLSKKNAITPINKAKL